MGDGCKDIERKQFSAPSGMNSRRSRLAVALQYFHFFRACNGWGGGAGGTQIAFLCHGGTPEIIQVSRTVYPLVN